MKQRLKAANEKYMYNKNILKQKSGQLSGRVPDSLLKGCGSSSGRVFIFQCQPSMLTPVLVSIPTLYWVFIFQCQPSMLTPVLVSVPTLYCVFIFHSQPSIHADSYFGFYYNPVLPQYHVKLKEPGHSARSAGLLLPIISRINV